MTTFTDKAPGIMAQLMVDFPFGVEDAAAFLGNFGHETGGLVHLVEHTGSKEWGGKGGIGWAQWTGQGRGGRRRLFEDYCRRNNLDRFSDKANYGFLFTELKGAEGKRVIPKLLAAKGLRDKTRVVCVEFERPGVVHMDSRVRYAELALAAFNATPTMEQKVALPEPPKSVSEMVKEKAVPVVLTGGSIAVLIDVLRSCAGV